MEHLEAATYQHLQLIWPFGDIRIEQLEITHEIGEHARLLLTGIISEQQEYDIVKFADSSSTIELYQNESPDRRHTLFMGMLKQVDIDVRKSYRVVSVEAVSHTYLMDTRPYERSFQQVDMALAEIAEHIISAYSGGDMIDLVFDDKRADQFVMQYQETDWEFLKRLASFAGAELVPDISAHKVRLWIGIPEGRRYDNLEDTAFVVRRDSRTYWEYKMNSLQETEESDFLTYTFVWDHLMQLGDEISRDGKVLVITKRYGVLEHGLLKWEYECAPPKGMYRQRVYNRSIIGASIEGKIIDVSRNQVKLHLEMDAGQRVEHARWFPYSAEGNQVWYMMPEKGTPVKLYFPSQDEDDAMVIQSVRQAPQGSYASTVNRKMADPGVKSFGNPQGKEFSLANKELTMTAKEGMLYISLNRDLGLRLNSTLGIRIQSLGELSEIYMSAGSIHLDATNSLQIETASDSLSLVEDVSFNSKQIVMDVPKEKRQVFAPIVTEFEEQLSALGVKKLEEQRRLSSNDAKLKGFLDAGSDLLKGIGQLVVDVADMAGYINADFDDNKNIVKPLLKTGDQPIEERNATLRGTVAAGINTAIYMNKIKSGEKTVGDLAGEVADAAAKLVYDDYVEPNIKKMTYDRNLDPLTSSEEEFYEAGRNEFDVDMIELDIAITAASAGTGGAIAKGAKFGTKLAPDVPSQTYKNKPKRDSDSDTDIDGNVRYLDGADEELIAGPLKDGKLKTSATPLSQKLSELGLIDKRIEQMLEVLKNEQLFVSTRSSFANGMGDFNQSLMLNPKIMAIWNGDGTKGPNRANGSNGNDLNRSNGNGSGAGDVGKLISGVDDLSDEARLKITTSQQATLNLHDRVYTHVTPDDLLGAEKELNGIPLLREDGSLVLREDGLPFNHMQEVSDSYRGLEKLKKSYEGILQNPNLDSELRQLYNSKINEVNASMNKIEDIFAPFGGILPPK